MWFNSKERFQSKLRTRVYRVLTEQQFVLNDVLKAEIETKIKNGRRYFFAVGKRVENGTLIDRFIKIPVNSSRKLLKPFARQVLIANFLSEKNVIRTRKVIDSNLSRWRGIPFAIMETFPVGNEKIGFIEGHAGVEFLTEIHAHNAITNILAFHEIDVALLPTHLKRLLVNHPADYSVFGKKIRKFLYKSVLPLDAHQKQREYFFKVLERRLSVNLLRERVSATLEKWAPFIMNTKNRGMYLIHGDMAPNNLYVFDSGKVELLDLEWVGVSTNRAMAMIVDFGNLRARSWNNRVFREALDTYLLEYYKAKGEEDLGRAIIALSILYSHILLSGYFENYEWEKQKLPQETQRRDETEKDILKAL